LSPPTSIVAASRHDLMQPISWLFAFLYIPFGLVVAQHIVIRTSGVKYSEFLKNVRMAPFERR
jgi:hypothetical protein